MIQVEPDGNEYVELFGKRYEVHNPPGGGNRRREKTFVGIDLDATLAYFDREAWGRDNLYIGPPIPKAVEKLRYIQEQGVKVKIFTARVGWWWTGDRQERIHAAEQLRAIDNWCEVNLGERLEVTSVKDFNCLFVLDDASKQMVFNTGMMLEESLDK